MTDTTPYKQFVRVYYKLHATWHGGATLKGVIYLPNRHILEMYPYGVFLPA